MVGVFNNMGCNEETISSNFPENYDYKILSFEKKEGENFSCILKVKLLSKEKAEEWLNAYQQKTRTTWRKSRVVKTAGQINIFRGDFKCQHKTDQRFRYKGVKITKNTDCPATMKIIIKRYFEVPKLKNPDEATKMFPCEITLHSLHNHTLGSALALRFRDISTSTKNKLVKYFQAGHTASSARLALQNEILLENPQEYERLFDDSSILPTLSIIQHLLNNVKKSKVSSNSTDSVSTDSSLTDAVEAIISNTDDTSDFHETIANTEIKEKFKEWCYAIESGMEKNPHVFLPAVKELMFNSERYASTETDLVSALHNFGKYSAPDYLNIKGEKREDEQISVQAATAEKQKCLLSVKSELNGGSTAGCPPVPIIIRFPTFPLKRS